MLINARALRIKSPVTLTREQTQVLVNAEPFFMNAGLDAALWCIPCRKAKADFGCKGGFDPDRPEFTAECACRVRRYHGDDIVVPPAPTWTPLRSTTRQEKPVVQLSRQTMQFVDTFEQCLKSLELQYALYCLQCLAFGNASGVRGSKDSTALQTVFECDCTKRIYQGADAPATVH
jgi:hypothetical protein